MEVIYQRNLSIPVEKVNLTGDLSLPVHARSIIIFAHGSGSGRLSLRNQMVANYLIQHDFGTLLFDLLTPEEDTAVRNRFDIKLLSTRLIEATEWLENVPQAKGRHLGYFGASTGAASALYAAAALPQIDAVVSRGGRPDLAMEVLPAVKAPTLLIVGGADVDVLRMNKSALEHLHGEKKLEVVEGATHLFEEKGTMEKVCHLATAWFENHLSAKMLKP